MLPYIYRDPVKKENPMHMFLEYGFKAPGLTEKRNSGAISCDFMALRHRD